MNGPGPGNTSGTARLINGMLGFQVGWQEPVYLPTPAAGAAWTYTVDGRNFERLLSVYYVLAASAVVANRTTQLNLLDVAGRTILVVGAGATVTAGQTKFCSLQIQSPSIEGGIPSGSVGWLPDLLLPPGWQWQLVIANEDVADQVSGVVLLLQRFPNDATMVTAGE